MPYYHCSLLLGLIVNGNLITSDTTIKITVASVRTGYRARMETAMRETKHAQN